MKMTIVLLTAAFLNVSANGVSQTVSFSGKEVPMEKIFAEVEKQTGYVFLYSEPVINLSKTVTIKAENLSLEQFLKLVLKDQPLKFSIRSKSVIISPAAFSERAESSNIVYAVTPIKGRVLDADGNPLVGASVVVKGGKTSTSTNAEGVFSLNVSAGDVLLISFVGFESTEYKITPDVVASSRQVGTSPDRQPNNIADIIIKLTPSVFSLNEVVINKGYYTELKKFSTGNVGTITSKDIEKQPVQNPLLALQGRVPGLEITQTTGMNGGGVRVRIQGVNNFGSITGLVGSDPLIIVDGVSYPSKFSTATAGIDYFIGGGSPLNYISPSEIESITVLKDADATAIYGSRAANGAILITTKKGKIGKPKLAVDLQQGWGKVHRHVDMMNTRQYLDMRYEALKNDGIPLSSLDQSYDYDLTVWDTTRYTNWQKELIGGTAQYTNINVGVSGGTDLIQYLISANYNRQTTVFPGNFADRAGGMHFSINGNSPNQRLHIQLSGTNSSNQNRLPYFDLTQYAVFLEPDAPKLYNDDGSLNWAPKANGSSSWTNPLAKTIYTEYTNTTKNLISNLNISYAILPSLLLSSNFGYTDLRSDLFNGLKLERNSPEDRAIAGRSARFGTRNINSWIIEPQLGFEKNIGKGKLKTLIGSTVQKTNGTYLEVQATGQPTNELLHSLAAATTVKGTNVGNDADFTTRFNGVFGRIGYNWDKKYLINLTGRRDGSSKFGEENRFHNFWSTGAGWIFSEEKFFQSSRAWLSFGKLRASYGTTGNDQIADYSYLSLYNITNTNILYQGTTSFDVQGLPNPFLQWEETRKLQGGIDLSLFKERITLDITYARNRSSNQLIGYSLPSLTGFTSFTKNFPAIIQNTSWEFTLNTVNIRNKNINWSTNFNLTIPRNKVTSFPGIELTPYASGTNGVIVGEPIGIQKLYQDGGVDPSTGGYMILDKEGKTVPGFINGSTIQSAKVSFLPKYYGGISNAISYKGFQLDFFFQFVYQIGFKDNYYFNSFTPPGSFNNGAGNQAVTVLNRWQRPGDNTTIGRYNSDYSLTMWPPSTNAGYSYSAGSYLRLKNLSLSYQLPRSWSEKLHLQTGQIYFRGQNLATITGYNGLDPETRSLTTLSPLQMWTVGAKIEL